MKWMQGSTDLEAFGRVIPVSCDVRNEVNRRRLEAQVVYTMPDHIPYQPRIFPIGVWEVGTPRPDGDPYKAPFFIPTNAWRMVKAWDTEGGRYTKATDRSIKDSGYGLHFSTSNTTLGCIKILNKNNLLWLVDQINARLSVGEKLLFEVV